ncbi:hypothetical protein SAZ10_02605 [Mesorhizobium sp. BAC0120]|uniref:hypothetical protein n=1 Tax=Mesorhizobium sp. BAC0120 TaxID=3090670 RepID=UPI00298D4594|nr:hypothetical protein [Mesorhizobium sp. BAC0120]MDW6020648.1 hypothetical protein [Mesorhizobium sp. BAC0120]
MNLHDILLSVGIDPAVLYAGGAGGVLRALSRRKLKVREVLLSPVCGALAAAYLTLPVVHYVKAVGWPMPGEDPQSVLAGAFLIGTCAMWISDMVFEYIVRRFRPAEPPP